MNRINYIAIILAILTVFPFVAIGQNTSSPYSKFGVGDLSSIAYGRNLALGSSGLGIRDPYLLNLKNPASLTAIDSLNFLFETGVNIKRTNSESVDYSEKYWNGGFTHLAFGHRFSRHVMGSFGFMPYSDIGYRLRTVKSLEGENSFMVTDWVGSGGLMKFFGSFGFKLSKNFSLGTELGYYYGPLTESRKTVTMAESENPTYCLTNTRYRSVSAKLAFQYMAKIDDHGTGFVLGGYFSPGQRFWGKTELLIQQQYSTTTIDPMYYNDDIATSLFVPINYGVGLGFTMKGKYMLSADIERSNWNQANSSKSYIDQTCYSVGFEILPQNKLSYLKRCSYRFGYHYDTGYIQTKGYDVDDWRMSVGVGFPIQKSASMINCTFETGERGTTKMGLIRERYSKLTVAFSFQDFWFIKRKLN